MSIPAVWFVTDLYYPEESATGYYLTQMAEGLAPRHTVRVLCGYPKYTPISASTPHRELRHGVEITRCGGTSFRMDLLASRFLNMVTVSASIAWHAFRRLRSGDIVLVVTNPPSLPFVVSIAAGLRRARCVVLIHDVYPDVLVAAGLLQSSSWPVRFLERVHRWLYAKVQAIVVLGRDMHALIASRCRHPEKIHVITHWADTTEIRPLDRSQNHLLSELGLTDRLVVQYSGNMGRTHDTAGILDAAALLRNTPDIHFLLIGGGAGRKILDERLRRNPLPNVTLIPGKDRRQLPESLTACDIALVTFRPGMKGISVPSRMYNILAAGKPILALADLESELGRVILEDSLGWVVEPGDSTALAATLKDLRTKREEFPLIGARARKIAESKYTRGATIAALEQLLEVVRSGGMR